MRMIRLLGKIVVIIFTSFYFFPFEFRFLPGFNTKMIMAGLGLILLIYQLAKQRNSIISRSFFQLSLWSGVVSLFCFFSVVINDTNDYTYSTYLVSMWVWVAAAYFLIYLIRKLHGIVSIELVANYLIIVCIIQCLIAFLLVQSPSFTNFVSLFYEIDTKDDRMTGIGAGLDVAGSRFAAVLILIAYLLGRSSTTILKRYIGLYMGAFFIIAIIGNMISRTTTIGILFALVYFILMSKQVPSNTKKIVCWFGGILSVVVCCSIFLYHTDIIFREHIRFGFEGFFSLVEKGRWEVHSNEILKDMYVFPDNLKTWLIGDGYLNDPFGLDPYYTGIDWNGYYQNTDVGYLRFIYYFGLLGLIPFCIFMYKNYKVCACYFPTSQSLFLLFLLLNFIIWFKVSTDIFLVFALFLCIGGEENERYNQQISI